MRALAAVLVPLLAFPCAASAQSFFVRTARVLADGADVGEAASVPARLEPAEGTHARLRFDGHAVTVDAELDLATAHVQAGVGADTPLDGPYAPRMRANAWAPVLALSAAGTRIALPSGAPARTATIPAGSTAARGTPQGSPWEILTAGFDDDPQLHCAGMSLSPSAGAAPGWRPSDSMERRLARTVDGWDAIEVQVYGFVFTGWRRHDATCNQGEVGGIGLSGIGTRSGDGIGTGRVVVLPRGTALYSAADAPSAFATLRSNAFGIEALSAPPARHCDAAGHCTRVPPPPTGVARWIVEVHEGHGAAFLFHAWVKTPAEQLRDAGGAHGGFGLTTAGDGAWPEAAAAPPVP